MITSIIFDMDGVLVDSQPMHYDADVYTLKHFGITVTQKDVEKYAGTTNSERFAIFKEEFHIDDSVEEMVRYREECIMKFACEYPLKAMDGVRDLLVSIKAAGLQTAVASSSSYDLIYAVLDRLGIREFFDKVVSGEDMKNGKPAPDIFLKAAQVLDSTPKDCVVIEDSGNGVLAANRAGMKVVGYVNPGSGQQNLSTATIIIDDFNKICGEYLKNM